MKTLIQKTGGKQLHEKELQIAQLVLFEAHRSEHGEIATFDGHKHISQMLHVGSHQMKSFSEVLNVLALCFLFGRNNKEKGLGLVTGRFKG